MITLKFRILKSEYPDQDFIQIPNIFSVRSPCPPTPHPHRVRVAVLRKAVGTSLFFLLTVPSPLSLRLLEVFCSGQNRPRIEWKEEMKGFIDRADFAPLGPADE